MVSRYHYHFGADRRDSSEGVETSNNLMSSSSRSARNSFDKPVESDNEETETREYIGGFRQWTSSMQEDLVIMKNILLQADPNIDTSSKSFSRQLLTQFKYKHPHCMESERSLLSKLSQPQTKHQPSPVKHRTKSVVKVAATKKNPAVDIMSDIEGFDDWNLGKVKDFISCMDKARRKYTEMKENDPKMKLVPLLLEEWKIMYPSTVETVKSFLVRIRFLKTNKESIKAKLGEHDLLPRMSNEDSATAADDTEVTGDVDQEQPAAAAVGDKFVWDSLTMMPVVISTRAKAIAKQQKEASQGKRISYAKLWIQEFLKVYPNCPYTANNLSVHYWYWSTQQKKEREEAGVKKHQETVIHDDDEEEVIDEGPEWSDEHIEELRRLGDKVINMFKDATERKMKFSGLLHSVWSSLHPSSSETEQSLMIVYNKAINKQHHQERDLAQEAGDSVQRHGVRWTPLHNKALREIVTQLKSGGEYTRGQVVREWSRRFDKVSWDQLSSRIDDQGHDQPQHFVRVKQKKPASTKKSSASLSQLKQEVDSAATSGLNARGQMRWTQQAVTDLLECHKLGLKAKNSHPTKKLADLVHQKFKQRHPYCPIAPNVLLTKCYILRSELKSGKLTLTESSEDFGEKYRGESGLKHWTRAMLEELVMSRQRAITRKRMKMTGGQLLGDIWLEEMRKYYPDYKSSKKMLFRKYKWWRQRRAEMSKFINKNSPVVTIEEDSVLVLELRKSLTENSVELPPFVSSKVTSAVININ